MKKIAALLLAVLLVLTLAACGSGSSTKQEIDEAIEEAEKEIEAVEEEVGEAIDQAEQAAEEAVEEAAEPEPEAEAEPEPEAEAEPEPEAEAEPEPEPAYVNEEAGLRIVLPEGITEGEDEDFIFYSLDADGNRMIAVQELGDTSWLNSDDPQEAFALMMEGEFSDASVRHAVLGERVRPVLRTKSEGIPMDIFFVCSEDDSQRIWIVFSKQIRIRHSANTPPSSSAIAANTKSECASGIVPAAPWNRPMPNHPAVPIANSDCSTW